MHMSMDMHMHVHVHGPLHTHAHAHTGTGYRHAIDLEDGDRPHEKVGLRKEVGVEDGDELGRDRVVNLVHRASFVPLPVGPPNGLDFDAALAPVRDAIVHHFARRQVSRVVEALNVQLLARPIQPASVVDDPPSDKGLVEHGQLHAHLWWLGAPPPTLRVAARGLPIVWLQCSHRFVEHGRVKQVELVDGDQTACKGSEANKDLQQ